MVAIKLKDDDNSDGLLNDTIDEIKPQKTQTQKLLYDIAKPVAQNLGGQKRYMEPTVNNKFYDGGPKAKSSEKIINES